MFIDSQPNKPEIDYVPLQYLITSLYALKVRGVVFIIIINEV